MLTEGISTPISRHNKITDAVWRSQMSSLLQLKWDPADRYQYFKKRNPCRLLELGFKPSDKPHHNTSLFLTLSDVADRAGGSLTWPKEPVSPAAHSCPGTAPAAVPTEVFVQLHDEKQQGTDPAKERSAERTWGKKVLNWLRLVQIQREQPGSSIWHRFRAASWTLAQGEGPFCPLLNGLFLPSAKSAWRLLTTLNSKNWFSWGPVLWPPTLIERCQQLSGHCCTRRL